MHTGRILSRAYAAVGECKCYNVNINYTKYFPETLRPIVYALQNLHRKKNLVAPSIDGSAKCLVRYKVHLLL